MGAKTWMLVYSNGDAKRCLASRPQLDRARTEQLARKIFPGERLKAQSDGALEYTCPADNEILIGCFPGVSVVAASEFGIDYPSRLPMRFVSAGGYGTVTLHAMHSVVAWFAFAQWKNGRLIRSLSLSPDSGILEDVGTRYPFEIPYWSGEHPVETEDEECTYPFPFHPLDLGEAALAEFFGYQLEGDIRFCMFDPQSIPLMRFNRLRPWWKFW